MTTQERIDALWVQYDSLSATVQSYSINNRQVVYRKLDEILAHIDRLEARLRRGGEPTHNLAQYVREP